MIAQETQRLERLKAKQVQEVEVMLQQEMRMAAIRAKGEKKAKDDAEKQARRDRERERRRAAQAEQSRLKDLKR